MFGIQIRNVLDKSVFRASGIQIATLFNNVGAIWSSTSPDFGVSGVLDRFLQIRPKVIFSVEAVSYNMKTHDHLGKLRQVVDGLYDALQQVREHL